MASFPVLRDFPAPACFMHENGCPSTCIKKQRLLTKKGRFRRTTHISKFELRRLNKNRDSRILPPLSLFYYSTIILVTTFNSFPDTFSRYIPGESVRSVSTLYRLVPLFELIRVTSTVLPSSLTSSICKDSF